jgi:hypothetical protein
MNWLIALLTVLVQVVLPAWLEARKPQCADARSDTELRNRLFKKIRNAGWTIPLLGMLLMVGGCQKIRTVYVPSGEPVRLAQEVKDCRVWVKTDDGETLRGQFTLQEGWYVVPLETPEIPSAQTAPEEK